MDQRSNGRARRPEVGESCLPSAPDVDQGRGARQGQRHRARGRRRGEAPAAARARDQRRNGKLMGVLLDAECPNCGYTARIAAGYGGAGIEWEPYVCHDCRELVDVAVGASELPWFLTSTSAPTVAARTSSHF